MESSCKTFLTLNFERSLALIGDHVMSDLKLLNRNAVLEKLSISISTLERRLDCGEFPPPITMGYRSRYWAAHEINEIIKAYMSGKQGEELKVLASNIQSNRESMTTGGAV